MVKLLLTTHGIDKPGLISDISKIIYLVNGNIIESKMARLENIFTIIMSIEIPVKNKIIFKEKMKSIKGLQSTINTLDSFNDNNNYNQYKFSLECLDREGIINHFTTSFSKQQINVKEMDTTTTNAPITGIVLFNLDSIISIPKQLDIDELKNSLNILSEKYNVKYQLLLFESK